MSFQDSKNFVNDTPADNDDELSGQLCEIQILDGVKMKILEDSISNTTYPQPFKRRESLQMTPKLDPLELLKKVSSGGTESLKNPLTLNPESVEKNLKLPQAATALTNIVFQPIVHGVDGLVDTVQRDYGKVSNKLEENRNAITHRQHISLVKFHVKLTKKEMMHIYKTLKITSIGHEIRKISLQVFSDLLVHEKDIVIDSQKNKHMYGGGKTYYVSLKKGSESEILWLEAHHDRKYEQYALQFRHEVQKAFGVSVYLMDYFMLPIHLNDLFFASFLLMTLSSLYLLLFIPTNFEVQFLSTISLNFFTWCFYVGANFPFKSSNPLFPCDICIHAAFRIRSWIVFLANMYIHVIALVSYAIYLVYSDGWGTINTIIFCASALSILIGPLFTHTIMNKLAHTHAIFVGSFLIIMQLIIISVMFRALHKNEIHPCFHYLCMGTLLSASGLIVVYLYVWPKSIKWAARIQWLICGLIAIVPFVFMLLLYIRHPQWKSRGY